MEDPENKAEQRSVKVTWIRDSLGLNVLNLFSGSVYGSVCLTVGRHVGSISTLHLAGSIFEVCSWLMFHHGSKVQFSS